MNLLLKLVALARVVMPLPTLTDVKSVLAWWNGLGPAAADLIVLIATDLAQQVKETGYAAINLGDGRIITMQPNAEGVWCMAEEHSSALCTVAMDLGANGEIIKQLLELFLKVLPYILPLFIKNDPAPKPDPVI